MEEMEIIYNLTKTSLEYISPKERETAIFSLLYVLYENEYDLNDLQNYAENDENEWFSYQIQEFLKTYNNEEEEE